MRGRQRILELHAGRNAESRDRWETFAGHRRQVTRWLCQLWSKAGGGLCVLGAGNCNDLALPELLSCFGQVDLVDLDGAALQAGVNRQGLAAAPGLQLHGQVDVTGVAPLLSTLRPEVPATAEQVSRLLDTIRAAPRVLPGSFQVVASVCLLSQLLDSVKQTLGEAHPEFLDVVLAIRLRHLQSLLELTARGGAAVLITDVVSSLTLPQLLTVADSDLPSLLSDAIRTRNFFTGLNPEAIRRQVETDVTLAGHVTQVSSTDPWLWDFGPRVYLVCGMVMWKV